MDDDAILVENLSKVFKGSKNPKRKNNLIYALDDISFSVKKGQILGIIGQNGSGKTTLMRTISGVYSPTKGRIEINGKIAPILQIGIGFKNEISALENIVIYGMLLGLNKKEITNRIDSILKFAELENFSNMKLKFFSSGMRARLAFACAIQINADIFLVDEILAVGDMSFRQKSFKEFLKLKKNGKTIVHTTHNLGTLEEFSDIVMFLDKGKLIEIGEPKEVIKKYKSHIMRE